MVAPIRKKNLVPICISPLDFTSNSRYSINIGVNGKVKVTASQIAFFCPAFAALAAGCLAACLDLPQPACIVVKNQGFLPFADAPINYRSAELNDPIARLEQRLERGEVKLRYEPAHGYLRSVLNALRVPVRSQTLVFAKTSFQFPQINPAEPRALYFNDDVYVGQVHNGKFLEFVSFDPKQGAIFYVIDERPTAHPRFERAAVDCVQCHVASSTLARKVR